MIRDHFDFYADCSNYKGAFEQYDNHEKIFCIVYEKNVYIYAAMDRWTLSASVSRMWGNTFGTAGYNDGDTFWLLPEVEENYVSHV